MASNQRNKKRSGGRKTDQDRPYICLSCGSKFVSKSNLLSHCQDQHSNPDGTRGDHRCMYCGMWFIQLRGLKRHVQNKHDGTEKVTQVVATQTVYRFDDDSSWLCGAADSEGEVCNERFSHGNFENYKAHIAKHAQVDTFGRKIIVGTSEGVYFKQNTLPFQKFPHNPKCEQQQFYFMKNNFYILQMGRPNNVSYQC